MDRFVQASFLNLFQIFYFGFIGKQSYPFSGMVNKYFFKSSQTKK